MIFQLRYFPSNICQFHPRASVLRETLAFAFYSVDQCKGNVHSSKLSVVPVSDVGILCVAWRFTFVEVGFRKRFIWLISSELVLPA